MPAAGCTAAVLSGGAGTRIGGREKGLLPIDGSTFIETKLKSLSVIFKEFMIVAARPELYRFLERPGAAVRTVADAVEGFGALGGIYTALKASSDKASSTRYVFITTSDTPFLLPDLAARLCADAAAGNFDVFIPRRGGHIEPLCGVYSLGCIPAIEAIMPQRKIRLFYPLVRTGYLPEAELDKIDPKGRSFININTEEDYRRYISRGPLPG